MNLPDFESLIRISGICRGTLLDPASVQGLAERLGVDIDTARRIVWLAGARPEPAAAVILIGGRSKRMGTDKASMILDGIPAASRLYFRLTRCFDHVFFSAAPGQKSPVEGAHCVYDTIEDKGPISGLASALRASPYRVNFVIACDIPEIDPVLIRNLLACMIDYEIAVPCFSPGRMEPLFAVYDKAVASTAERLLRENSLKLLSIYDHHRLVVVPATDAEWYHNLNTPDDVQNYIGETPLLIESTEVDRT